MTTERQVIYLKDKFRDYFLGGKESIRVLMNALVDLNSDKPDMSKVTLDIKDVIINQEVEQLLYNWMADYDLDVIDTTEDEIVAWNPETETLEKTKVPMTFRQEALDEKKRQLKIQRMSVDVRQFYVYDDELRKEVFNKEYSAKKLVELINERMKSGNKNKLLLSVKNVNINDDYSVRQLSAFLIQAVNYVEIAPVDTRSTVARFGLLPTISQLCYDFSLGENSWHDIKKKHPVGSELYFSPNETEYIKGRVVKSITEDEEGNPYSEKEYLTAKDKERYYLMYFEYDVLDDEGNVISTQEFKLRASFVIAREVLVFPCSIFEGGVSDGMPTPSELSKHLQNNDIRSRKKKVISEHDAILLNSGGSENKDTDWIEEYRTLVRSHYRDKGIEIPKIDLLRIIKGERSPFSGLFYGMDMKK